MDHKRTINEPRTDHKRTINGNMKSRTLNGSARTDDGNQEPTAKSGGTINDTEVPEPIKGQTKPKEGQKVAQINPKKGAKQILKKGPNKS
jgi:hypothetical protein